MTRPPSLDSQPPRDRSHWFARLATVLSLWLALVIPAEAADDPFDGCRQLAHNGNQVAAIECYSDQIDDHAGTELYLERADAWYQLGHVREARADLEQALALQPSDKQTVHIRLLQGQLDLSRRQLIEAWQKTLQAGELAVGIGDLQLQAAVEQLSGDIKRSAGLIDEALEHQLRALHLATEAGDHPRQITLQLILIRQGMGDPAPGERLAQARALLEHLPTSGHKWSLAVALGVAASDLGLAQDAWQLLSEASRGAKALGHPRMHSLALGELSQLYESQQRPGDALRLARAALAAADPTRDRDLLMRWEWAQARLLRATDQADESLAAHRRAIKHLHAIRSDMPVDYSDGRSSFRDTQEPIYLGLVELLLERARSETGEARQALLDEVQQTMELLKTAELQDYFKDSCAVTPSSLSALGALQQDTAVLYPIILPDRLELLVQIGDTKYNVTSDAPAAKIQLLTARLSRTLRPSNGIRPFSKHIAKSLYDVLIAPLEPLLKEHEVSTLVYLPDGPLRQIPLDSLWDGKGFLVERYAIAIAPGLTLLDPKPIPRSGIQGLIAGVSRPGKVVTKLPNDVQSALLGSGQLTATDQAGRNRAMFRALFRATPSSGPTPVTTQPEGEPVTLTLRAMEQLQDALALPGVSTELDRISAIIPSERLQDDQFVLDRFAKEVGKSFRIVHIASHGLFSGDPERSFIITHDALLDMNRLADLFRSGAQSDEPVEILTLSACQTAEGDERSPLGLSGVAIKSGARSAVGSLWPVADEAAQTLLPDFYHNLATTTESKAVALQQAKVALMQDQRFAHPAFWSPFILIGNWL